MSLRYFFALSIAAFLSVPAFGQFNISVQQNGQASNVANGAAIVLNSAAVGQNATATVTITNASANNVVFGAAAQLLGSPTFTATDTAVTLTAFQSTSFTIQYAPQSSAAAVGQFLWPYTTQSGGVANGVGDISFNLTGTAPSLSFGQVASNGSFQPILNGGVIQFPATLLNNTASVTFAIANTGSGAASISAIAVSGADFSLGGVPVLPLNLNAGNQINLTAQFTPPASGAQSGSIQVTFTGGTFMATLSGTGITSFFSYQITEDGATTAISPGQNIALDNVAVGSTSTAVLQFQNTSASPVVLNTVALSGVGFSVPSSPFLPVTVQPQQTESLTITFTPLQTGPFTGRLQVGTDSFSLSATGLGPQLTYSYVVGGATNSVIPGGVVSFPTVGEGKTTSVQFTITNTGTVAASVAGIGIIDPTGSFALGSLPAVPLQLNPSATATFSINFSPVSVGSLSATLSINNSVFNLTGFSTAPPPLPAYQFTGASGTQQPFQQPAIGLSLSSPYSLNLSGTLTITIISNSFVVDPAVQFSSGTQKVAFTIPANTLKAVFPNGATQIQLQTGTVAGSIQITPDFTVGSGNGTDITPGNPTTLTLTVPALAPALLSVSLGAQTAVSFSVVLTGFTTTRSLESLTFQLTPASGAKVSATSFTIDLTSASTVWFEGAASSAVGGQFSITVPFDLAQSGASASANLVAKISAISVTATSATGASNSLQVLVP